MNPWLGDAIVMAVWRGRGLNEASGGNCRAQLIYLFSRTQSVFHTASYSSSFTKQARQRGCFARFMRSCSTAVKLGMVISEGP